MAVEVHRSPFSPPRDYEGVDNVMVDVDGETVEVTIHPTFGPELIKPGDANRADVVKNQDHFSDANYHGACRSTYQKGWHRMTSTEQKVLLHSVARRNLKYKQSLAEELEAKQVAEDAKASGN
mmetsp:Transcript_24861/g.54137  ORF Transcript_24861/g.54137 Transcript_24861/m.54137 type:complete len:123 (+) Transcript_24861:70-438(+)